MLGSFLIILQRNKNPVAVSACSVFPAKFFLSNPMLYAVRYFSLQVSTARDFFSFYNQTKQGC